VSVGSLAGYAMAYWIIAGVVTDLAARLAPVWRQPAPASRVQGAATALRQVGRASAGMMLAHLGVAAFILGVTVVRTHETERDVKMQIGDTTEVGGHVFQLMALREVQGANYNAMQGLVLVTRNGQPVATLRPEKRIYRVQQNPMTEAAIASNLGRDLYVSLGEALPDGAWTLRVQYKPMIVWIWLGCLMMAAGGALAASDRRYRQANRMARPEAVPLATARPMTLQQEGRA
jgi:cytochrome c-type biogenesis protein CcmF